MRPRPSHHHLIVKRADAFFLLEAPAKIGRVCKPYSDGGVGYRVAIVQEFFCLVYPDICQVLERGCPGDLFEYLVCIRDTDLVNIR